jgi:hypothetical protein
MAKEKVRNPQIETCASRAAEQAKREEQARKQQVLRDEIEDRLKKSGTRYNGAFDSPVNKKPLNGEEKK